MIAVVRATHLQIDTVLDLVNLLLVELSDESSMLAGVSARSCWPLCDRKGNLVDGHVSR